MSKIDVSLSDSDKEVGIFHDLRYTNECDGGNSSSSMFEIQNVSGNELFIEVCVSEQVQHGKWQRNWYPVAQGQGVDGVRIHITGGIENGEFLRMLQLILEAEKMVEIIKP